MITQEILFKHTFTYHVVNYERVLACRYLKKIYFKEKPPMYVVGDVAGKVAILIDDIIDDVKPLSSAAKVHIITTS